MDWPPLTEEPAVKVWPFPGQGSSPGHGGAYQIFGELSIDMTMSPARLFSHSRTTNCASVPWTPWSPYTVSASPPTPPSLLSIFVMCCIWKLKYWGKRPHGILIAGYA